MMGDFSSAHLLLTNAHVSSCLEAYATISGMSPNGRFADSATNGMAGSGLGMEAR